MKLRAVLVLFGAALAAWAAEAQHVYILHTNDIHGALLPSEAWWLSRDFPPRLSNGPGALEVIRSFLERSVVIEGEIGSPGRVRIK